MMFVLFTYEGFCAFVNSQDGNKSISNKTLDTASWSNCVIGEYFKSLFPGVTLDDNSLFAWQLTTIFVINKFPSNITHRLIRSCYSKYYSLQHDILLCPKISIQLNILNGIFLMMTLT